METARVEFDTREKVYTINSESLAEVYRFDANGNHLNSIALLSAQPLYTFEYEAGKAAGQLNRIWLRTEGDTEFMSIQRAETKIIKIFKGTEGRTRPIQTISLNLTLTGLISSIEVKFKKNIFFIF